MKAVVMWRLYRLGTDKADKAAMLGRMLRWAQSKDNPPPPRITFCVGLVLCCHMPSQYAINRTRDSLNEGADMMLAGAEIVVHDAKKLQPGFPKLTMIQSFCFAPHIIYAFLSLSRKWAESARLLLGSGGELLLEASDTYSFQLHHARFMARNNYDYIHSVRALFSL